MSGAVVVTADDLVVGVVRGHSAAEGTGSLTATRMEVVASLPSDVTQLFLSALRVPNLWEWPRVPTQVGKANELQGKLERPLGPAELPALRPRVAADRVARMPHDEAVFLLATALIGASAAVLEVFLTRDKGRDKDRVISILADIEQERAKEVIAAIPSAEDWLNQLPEAVEAIANREDDQSVDLGKNVGGLALAASSPQGTQGYYKRYEGGLIYWSARGGAQVTIGEIGEYHNVQGGSGGRLGFPLSPELDAEPSPSGTAGKFQRFESSFDYDPETCQRLHMGCGGTVYWSEHGWSEHGAHATWGGIGEYYELNGGTGGALGFPVSDEIEAGPAHRDAEPKTTGWCQHFEGGAVYWSEKTKAVAVPRPVTDYLDRHHGVASPRGFPVSPDLPAADSPFGTRGHLQRFEGAWDYPRDILDHWSDPEGPGGATIYTSEAHGVHCVGWGNGMLYERLAGTSSWLGFPKSDETDARASKDEPWCTIQEFEGGAIFYKEKYGSVPVSGSIMDYLSQHDSLRKQLGFPVKEVKSLVSGDDDQVQFFEHGIVTVRKGMIEAWLRGKDEAQET